MHRYTSAKPIFIAEQCLKNKVWSQFLYSTTVKRLIKKKKNKETGSMSDLKRSGRPLTSRSTQKIKAVCESVGGSQEHHFGTLHTNRTSRKKSFCIFILTKFNWFKTSSILTTLIEQNLLSELWNNNKRMVIFLTIFIIFSDQPFSSWWLSKSTKLSYLEFNLRVIVKKQIHPQCVGANFGLEASRFSLSRHGNADFCA